jgi:eukaryotic-like serine/threonine-protein kinase
VTPLPLASPVAIGEIVAGKYRVESVLGTGAMGIVVGARHIALDHTVAIKLLLHHRYGSREESIARFLTEARAAARIDSDHVARVHDVGTLPDGTPFMVMEHLEGWDLERELDTRGPLPILEAVDFVLQAADAIAAADQVGIVHRDLKPANLFLAVRADGFRRVKVLDFGISKIATDRHSQRPREDGSFGSPAYMSPEQITDPATVDTRTDVWALGTILYELVTGQLAFVAPTVKGTLDTVLTSDPCPMRALRRDVPPELEAIVMKCLARDRDDRFRNAGDLAYALAPFGPGGSLGLIPTSGLSSMEPMVASVSSMHVFGREAMQTEPDPEESAHRTNLAIRERKARDAVLLVSSAALLFATIAIVSWQLSRARPRAPVAASAPPPVATVAAPVVPSASVQSATNSVQTTHVAPTPPPRNAHPRTSPKR